MRLPLHGFLRLVRMALVITTAWIVAALFFSWQHNAMIQARGQQDDLRERTLAMSASMMAWALLTPVVFYVSDLFPLRRARLLRNSVIMIGISVAVAAFRASFDGYLPVLLEGLPFTAVDYRASVLTLFHNYLLLTFLLIGIANFVRVEREDAARRRAEPQLEAELAAARLRQLRADLQPHFLFNTLNAVAALLHRDPEAAAKMLGRIRELIGASVAAGDAREVALADELEFIARYLDIQKMRFGSKLSSEIRIAHTRLERAAVPPLLLQPLVENSIVHGIANRRDGGRVVVEVDATERWLILRVRDNGPGSPDKISWRGSIGIPNAMARLESLYGAEQSLTYRREGQELVADIRIPLRIMDRAA